MFGKKTKDIVFVEAYAARLQKELGISVSYRSFYNAGWNGPVTGTPCSLMTIEPFCPEGKRTFTLNSHHPLIIEIAKFSADHTNNEDKSKDGGVKEGITTLSAAEIPIMMGEAMVNTSSWPQFGLDFYHLNGGLHWKQSPTLVCGPQRMMITPVPLLSVHEKGLAIFPKRILNAMIHYDKGDHTKFGIDQILQGDTWELRDGMLWDEWKHHLQELKSQKPTLLKYSSGEQQQECAIQEERRACIKLVSYSPSLPVLLLAQFICSGGGEAPLFLHTKADAKLKSSRSKAMSTAASVLLSCDRLFCLSLFFNVPLMDRTKVLLGSIRVHCLVESTPTKEEVNLYRQTAPETAHDALNEAILQRAEALWVQAKDCSIMVAWSGGIDSTTVLVALLRTAENESQRLNQLSVIMDDASISENPQFYENHIKNKLSIIDRKGRSLSKIAKEYDKGKARALLVTGELGDQLFGSSKCEIAFPRPLPESLTSEQKCLMDTYSNLNEDTTNVTLDQPWETSLLPILNENGLLAGGVDEWKDWILPQLTKAPLPIITLHDMLWWLNFSCKWQDVMLRCLIDGGLYEPKSRLTGIIHHFYDSKKLQCWACVPDFHKFKFPDLKDWKTYKEPLKRFIYSFDGNNDYYTGKEKVGSLCFDLGEEILRKRTCSGLALVSKDTIKPLTWGNACIRDCRAEDLSQYIYDDPSLSQNGATTLSTINVVDLFEPWILNESRSKPAMVSNYVEVNPWENDNGYCVSPFERVTDFAQEDERKYRKYNVVTAVTLEAKCASLLDPDSMSGKSVLDLGACLGAMMHWALFYGASKAVGVEPQRNFCDRMHALLQKASHTWPETNGIERSKKYQVICSDARTFLSKCADQSYDIVVAAGVLHCFQDPISIITEISRIAKERVVIESVYPSYSRVGIQDTSSTQPINLMELAPSAQVNKATEHTSITGLSVVPSKALIESIMHAAGFDTCTVKLVEHPTGNQDADQYIMSKRCDGTPLRFFLRCIRRSKTQPTTFKTLERVIIDGEEAMTDRNKVSWDKKELWTQFSRPSEAMNTEIPTSVIKQPKPFVTWTDVEREAHGIIYDDTDDVCPFMVRGWGSSSDVPSISIDNHHSVTYGFVYSGETNLSRQVGGKNLQSSLVAGMFFSCPGKVMIEGGSGFYITVKSEEIARKCLFNVGGPLEKDENGQLIGMLAYIDGCSDSILINPALYGYPCLNQLHFPKYIKQTQHTHPSGRAGIVFQGEGKCVIETSTKRKETPLRPGMVFVIPKDSQHAFETDSSTLDIIAFHPDSDVGPTDTNHPMVNRTIVDGVSASMIPSIQTSPSSK